MHGTSIKCCNTCISLVGQYNKPLRIVDESALRFHFILLFVGLVIGGWLFLRAKTDVSTVEVPGQNVGSTLSLDDVTQIQRAKVIGRAEIVSTQVAGLFPEARDFVFDFSVWTQFRLSSFVRAAVHPDELSDQELRERAAAFFTAALLQQVPARFLRSRDEIAVEDFLTATLHGCVGAHLEARAIETTVAYAMTMEIPDSREYAWCQGRKAARLKQGGHEPARVENLLREAMLNVEKRANGLLEKPSHLGLRSP